MTVEARREAIRQLVDCVRALHQMSPPRNSRGEIIVPPFLHGDTLECPYQLPASRVIELLGRARALPRVDVGLIDAAIRFVLDRNQVFTAAENTSLIHGDLHFGNVLWDGEQITALLDFEWVRGGPADLDLDVLLRVVADPEIHQAGKITGPALTPAQSRAMYADVPKWCREFYPEWFANPNLLARLELYGLSFDVRDLLTQTPRAAAADQSALHPINRIKALVENRNHLTWLEW